MTLLPPLHVGRLHSNAIRFFRSPLEGPDTAWVVIDDLCRCLEFDVGLRQVFQRGVQADWSSSVRTVATADGVVTIGPHFMAQGLLEALAEVNPSADEVYQAYLREGLRALKVLTAGMTARDRMLYSLSALGRGAEELA